jgi:hypothetical protein
MQLLGVCNILYCNVIKNPQQFDEIVQDFLHVTNGQRPKWSLFGY